MTITNIPDEVYVVFIDECDATAVKGTFNRDSACTSVSTQPASVKNNAAQITVKAYVGGLFGANNKEVYCDSASKDKCVFALDQYQSGRGYSYVPHAQSAPLSFSKSDKPKVTLSRHPTNLGKSTKIKVTVSNVEQYVAVAQVALCSTKQPTCNSDGHSTLAGIDIPSGRHYGSGLVTIKAGRTFAPSRPLCTYQTNGHCALEIVVGDWRIAIPVSFAKPTSRHSTRPASREA